MSQSVQRGGAMHTLDQVRLWTSFESSPVSVNPVYSGTKDVEIFPKNSYFDNDLDQNSTMLLYAINLSYNI